MQTLQPLKVLAARTCSGQLGCQPRRPRWNVQSRWLDDGIARCHEKRLD
jgi:hypothetical protein